MENRSLYTIQFAALTQGEHSYDYHITDQFFTGYENSLIEKADVKVEVILMKGINNLQFTFAMKGHITVTCVKCLDPFELPIDETRHLLVRQVDAETTGEEEEDIVSIPVTEHAFDVSDHIYDYLNLMVPLSPVHPDKKDGKSGCNQKALKEMQSHLKQESGNDARWDILKNLKLK